MSKPMADVKDIRKSAASVVVLTAEDEDCYFDTDNFDEPAYMPNTPEQKMPLVKGATRPPSRAVLEQFKSEFAKLWGMQAIIWKENTSFPAPKLCLFHR